MDDRVPFPVFGHRKIFLSGDLFGFDRCIRDSSGDTYTSCGIILSILEIIAGFGILFDIRGSLAIISGLLVVFVLVLAYGIYMGFDIDCGCFGPNDPESKAFHGLRSALARDIVMGAGIIYLYAFRRMTSISTLSVHPVKLIIFKGRKKHAFK